MQAQRRDEDLMKARVKIIQPSYDIQPVSLTQQQIETKAAHVVDQSNAHELQNVQQAYNLERETANKRHEQDVERILSHDEQNRSLEQAHSGRSQDDESGMSW